MKKYSSDTNYLGSGEGVWKTQEEAERSVNKRAFVDAFAKYHNKKLKITTNATVVTPQQQQRQRRFQVRKVVVARWEQHAETIETWSIYIFTDILFCFVVIVFIAVGKKGERKENKINQFDCKLT